MSSTIPAGSRAGFYGRVSTGKQAEEGLSLEAAAQRARDRAEREGWTLTMYCDPGVKGDVESRPDLDRMMADVDAGLLDVVIFDFLDRLGRTQRLWHANLGRLMDAGTRLVSLHEDIDTSTPEGMALYGLRAIFAELEKRRISERVSGIQAARKAKGLHGGSGHYGYDKAGGLLTVRPEQAVIVERMHDEWQAGVTQIEIARRLEADGVPTSTGSSRKPRKRAPGQWWQSTVARILKDPVLAGLNAEGEPCACGHEAIIPVEVWRRSQKLMEGEGSPARRGRNPTSLLFKKGMLRCGLCREAMQGRRVRGVTEYMCMTRAREGKAGCPMPIVRPGEPVDRAVLDHFTTVGLSLEDTCAEVVAAHDRQLAEARLLREQAERAGLQVAERKQRVRRDYMDGELPANVWQDMDAELTAEGSAAAAEADRHRQREAKLAEHDALAEAEQQVLEHLAAIRAEIAGDVSEQRTLAGLRKALLALFEGFTLYNVDLASEAQLAALMRADLFPPAPGYVIEPHVRVEAIASTTPDLPGAELHRVPLALGRNKEPARSHTA